MERSTDVRLSFDDDTNETTLDRGREQGQVGLRFLHAHHPDVHVHVGHSRNPATFL